MHRIDWTAIAIGLAGLAGFASWIALAVYAFRHVA